MFMVSGVLLARDHLTTVVLPQPQDQAPPDEDPVDSDFDELYQDDAVIQDDAGGVDLVNDEPPPEQQQQPPLEQQQQQQQPAQVVIKCCVCVDSVATQQCNQYHVYLCAGHHDLALRKGNCNSHTAVDRYIILFNYTTTNQTITV